MFTAPRMIFSRSWGNAEPLVGRGSRTFYDFHNAEDDFQSIVGQRRTARRAVGLTTCHSFTETRGKDSGVSFASRGGQLSVGPRLGGLIGFAHSGSGQITDVATPVRSSGASPYQLIGLAHGGSGRVT